MQMTIMRFNIHQKITYKHPFENFIDLFYVESVINDFVTSYLWALDCSRQTLLSKEKENV